MKPSWDCRLVSIRTLSGNLSNKMGRLSNIALLTSTTISFHACDWSHTSCSRCVIPEFEKYHRLKVTTVLLICVIGLLLLELDFHNSVLQHIIIITSLLLDYLLLRKDLPCVVFSAHFERFDCSLPCGESRIGP